MENDHVILYAGGAVGGAIVVYMLWLILAELKSLNRYFRKGVEETDTLRSSSTGSRQRRSGSGGSSGGSRSGHSRV
jgi:hypothetical protein